MFLSTFFYCRLYASQPTLKLCIRRRVPTTFTLSHIWQLLQQRPNPFCRPSIRRAATASVHQQPPCTVPFPTPAVPSPALSGSGRRCRRRRPRHVTRGAPEVCWRCSCSADCASFSVRFTPTSTSLVSTRGRPIAPLGNTSVDRLRPPTTPLSRPQRTCSCSKSPDQFGRGRH
jgi:hypothetical protein